MNLPDIGSIENAIKLHKKVEDQLPILGTGDLRPTEESADDLNLSAIELATNEFKYNNKNEVRLRYLKFIDDLDILIGAGEWWRDVVSELSG